MANNSNPHYQAYNKMFCSNTSANNSKPEKRNDLMLDRNKKIIRRDFENVPDSILNQKESSDISICSNIVLSTGSDGEDMQTRVKREISAYKKAISKPRPKDKKLVLKNINQKSKICYGLKYQKFIRFCDSWFPIDSSILDPLEMKRLEFFPLPIEMFEDKRVTKIWGSPEDQMHYLDLENKWPIHQQLGMEMKNLGWYLDW